MVYVLISYFLKHQLQHYKSIIFIEDDTEGISNIHTILFEVPTAHYAQEWRFSYLKYALFSGIFNNNV